MNIQFGRDICGDRHSAEQREWLVTNGIGGYACGTIAGLLTRQHHGLLVAALHPPVGRTLLVSKLDEIAVYNQHTYALHTNRWLDGTIEPHGYWHIEQFHLDGMIPTWWFACGDALLEKQVWMQLGANTTYSRYTLRRASDPLHLTLKGLVNYRDHHHRTIDANWRPQIDSATHGICITAFPNATPFYLLSSAAEVTRAGEWYTGYDLAVERYRGIGDRDDQFYAANFSVSLNPGESVTIVASTAADPNLDGAAAFAERRAYEQDLRDRWRSTATYLPVQDGFTSVEQAVLAADQFIVDRKIPPMPDAERSQAAADTDPVTVGKTVIAGYPWFGDWGRDTMISLPGLTIATGRPEIARPILRTFARYLDQGMLPNLFPDEGGSPGYNTVDAILWYFEAIRAYHDATQDDDLLRELFPALVEVIEWHQRGTRYNIHLDPSDGLIYAGEPGVQLTWMDAKVDDWVVTPRIGKPVEISALWYNALLIMVSIAKRLDKPYEEYVRLAQQTQTGFQRFWNPERGYCYDVLDGPDGNDDSLRPNQIFAIALPTEASHDAVSLLKPEQQRSVIDVTAESLLTSFGLRSLAPDHPDYKGQYGGDRYQRDGAYHQGTVWGWLLGPFVQAHWRVYHDRAIALSFLEPMFTHLRGGCVGTLSEIFDGNPPFSPRGAFAQAWTVAELLRVWALVSRA